MARKYSLYVEKDEVVGVELDGKRYDSVDLIPDEDERAKMEVLVNSFSEALFFGSDAENDMKVTGNMPETMGKALTLVFGGVALLMLAIAIFSGFYVGRNISKEVSVPGHVVDFVERAGMDNDVFFYPVVEFYLPDGTLQTAYLSEGSWPPAYTKGQAVTISYDPQQPNNAHIRSFSSTAGRWTVTLVTGILGAAFLAAAVFAWWMYKQDMPKIPEGVGP